jgi:hypothetical protein
MSLFYISQRVPPDMFVKEKERISDYRMKLSCSADSQVSSVCISITLEQVGQIPLLLLHQYIKF